VQQRRHPAFDRVRPFEAEKDHRSLPARLPSFVSGEFHILRVKPEPLVDGGDVPDQ